MVEWLVVFVLFSWQETPQRFQHIQNITKHITDPNPGGGVSFLGPDQYAFIRRLVSWGWPSIELQQRNWLDHKWLTNDRNSQLSTGRLVHNPLLSLHNCANEVTFFPQSVVNFFPLVLHAKLFWCVFDFFLPKKCPNGIFAIQGNFFRPHFAPGWNWPPWAALDRGGGGMRPTPTYPHIEPCHAQNKHSLTNIVVFFELKFIWFYFSNCLLVSVPYEWVLRL